MKLGAAKAPEAKPLTVRTKVTVSTSVVQESILEIGVHKCLLVALRHDQYLISVLAGFQSSCSEHNLCADKSEMP